MSNLVLTSGGTQALKAQFNAQLMEIPRALLHYDTIEKKLVPFGWPVIIYFALHPERWDEHRKTHEFLYPCCLCPSDAYLGDGKYKETVMRRTGRSHWDRRPEQQPSQYGSGRTQDEGRWIVQCAQFKCDYYACLNEYIGKEDIRLMPYTLRGQYKSSARTEWTSVSLTQDYFIDILVLKKDVPSRLRRLKLMRGCSSIQFFQMWKLDARTQPGMTAAEFYKTFTRCLCGLIMTRRAFRWHLCRHTIIDLTGEDSEDEPNVSSEDGDDVIDLTQDSSRIDVTV